MRKGLRWLIAGAAFPATVACSLLVDTDDLTGRADADGGDDAAPAEGGAVDAPNVDADALVETDGDVEVGTLLFAAGYGRTGDEYWGPIVAAGEGVTVTGTFQQGVDFGSGVAFESNDGTRRAFFATLDSMGKATTGTVYGPPPLTGTGSAWPGGVDRTANGLVFHVTNFSSSIVVGDAAIPGDNGDAIIVHASSTKPPDLFNGSGEQEITSIADYASLGIAVAGINTGELNAFGKKYDASTPTGDASARDLFVGRVTSVAPWLKQFGGRILGARVAVDNEGNIIVAGSFEGVLDFGVGAMTCDGAADVFVAKLDPQGVPLWSQRYGNALLQSANGLSVDVSGNIVVAGSFTGSIDFGDGQRVTAGGSDTFVAKLDPSGQIIWSKRFGGTGNDFARNLATDANQNIVILGECGAPLDFGASPQCGAGGNADVFIVKLDGTGSRVWHRLLHGTQTRFVSSVATTPAGAVWVGGHYRGTLDIDGFGLDGGPDAGTGYNLYLIKFSP